MSTFENRVELWRAVCATIDRSAQDAAGLAARLSEAAGESLEVELARYLATHGFDVERSAPGVTGGLHASSRHFNAEDMRKGLKHGHVAFVVGTDRAHPLDVVAAAAAAVGLAPALKEVFGEVTLIAIESLDGLRELCGEGVFNDPDCVFTFRATHDGDGFQHTIASSGNHLAGVTLEVKRANGHEVDQERLLAAVASCADALNDDERIEATRGGIAVQAPRATRVAEIAAQLGEAVVARCAGDAAIEVSLGPLNEELLPSRILARRVKTFADTLQVKQDRIQKQEYGAPTPWGQVSHEVATVIVGYPLDTVTPPDSAQALGIAKAAAGAGLDVLGDMEFRGFVDGERLRALSERGLERTPRRWLGVHPVLPPQDGLSRRINIPDVIVRGPGLPAPTLEELIDDEAS